MSEKRLRVRRIFLLSGVTGDVREDLGKKITDIGGVYLETEVFKSSCTHVICGKLSRGEKFLGACATGKWILVPEYVTESVKAKEWLDEEFYEWGPRWAKKGDYPEDILCAPASWRRHVADKKKGAFAEWKAAVLVESLKRKKVYRRLLQDGGAKVYTLPPLPNAAHKLSRILTHVFVHLDDNETLKNLNKEGFECFVPNYIGDYLIKGTAATADASDVEDPKVTAKGCNTRRQCTSPSVVKQAQGCRELGTSASGSTVDSPIPEPKRCWLQSDAKIRQTCDGREQGMSGGKAKETKPETRRTTRSHKRKGKAHLDASQRSMDQYCFCSPKVKSDSSMVTSSQESTRSLANSLSSSRSSSPVSSMLLTPGKSRECVSPSLLASGQSTSLVSVDSSENRTWNTSSDVFASTEEDVIFEKIVTPSKSSGLHSSGVSPRLSPLTNCSLKVKTKAKPLKQLSVPAQPHAVSSKESSKISGMLKNERFSIDTSSCLQSSFQLVQDWVGMKRRVTRSAASVISENSLKAVVGSSDISDISSVSEVSSRNSSRGSTYSYNSSNTEARSARHASSKSASPGNSSLPFDQMSSNSEVKPSGLKQLRKSTDSEPLSVVSVTKRCSSLSSVSMRNCDTPPLRNKQPQSPSTPNTVSTKSSSCFVVPDVLSDQDRTSRSSEGFTDWSEMRGSSSSNMDIRNSSDITYYSTSPSCFYNTSGSQKADRSAVLTSVKQISPQSRCDSRISSSSGASSYTRRRSARQAARKSVSLCKTCLPSDSDIKSEKSKQVSKSTLDSKPVISMVKRSSSRNSVAVRNSITPPFTSCLPQSPTTSDTTSTKSGSCFIVIDTLSDQDRTSRSSEGFTDWSKIPGDSSSNHSTHSTSHVTNYSTSPSCFYNNSGSEKSLPFIKPSATCNSALSPLPRAKYEPDKTLKREVELSPTSSTCSVKKCPSSAKSSSGGRSLQKASSGTPSIKKFFPSSREVTPSPSSSQKSMLKSGGVKINGVQAVSQELAPLSPAGKTPCYPSLAPAVKAVKRKIFRDLDIIEVIPVRKKSKIVRDPNSWRPSMFGVATCNKRSAPSDLSDMTRPRKKLRSTSMSVSMPMTSAYSGIIETCLEDGFVKSAIDLLFSAVSSKTYPQSNMLHVIMTQVLRDSTQSYYANRAYNFLRAVLREHPPHPDEPAVRATYLQSFCPGGKLDGVLGQERDFFISVIRPLVWSPDDNLEEAPGELYRDNCTLLLRYIVALLESDMANLCSSKPHCQLSQRDVRSCILGGMFWPGSQQITVDKHCKEILDLLTTSLDLWRSSHSHMDVVDLLLKVVSMVATCFRMVDQMERQCWKILKGERVSSLVYELTRRLSGMPMNVLQLVLTRLTPPWVGLGVCHVLTGAMDDSLLQATLTEDGEELSFRNIMTKDIYLLPPLECVGTQVKNYSSPRSMGALPEGCRTASSSRSGRLPGGSVSSGSISSTSSVSGQQTPGTLKRLHAKLNKRNSKGETALHSACAKNKVSKVREILATSGIEVNASDNYGWTPLHEAACKGHINCVVELLKYRPARTITSYFHKGTGVSGERVNLSAVNHEGVTPLHGAVIYNRVEVAHTLLQHGGERLLKAKTAVGDTPLSVCWTEDMRTVLTSPCSQIAPSPRKLRRAALNLSQCSQDSESSFSFSQDLLGTPQSSCPAPEVYTAVLGEGPSALHPLQEECLKYICVLQHKIRLYITCQRLSQAALKVSTDKENLQQDLMSMLAIDTPEKSTKTLTPATPDRLSVRKQEDSTSKSLTTKEALCRLEDDVKVYLKLRQYLEGWRLHLKQVCSEADYREISPKLKAWISLCV